MPRIKALLTACAAGAFALTALATPVAATTPTKLAIVNGDPFRKVDICLNGRQIAGNVAYTRTILRRSAKDDPVVKFFSFKHKGCKGTPLAKVRVHPDDAVVVLTRKTPQRVVVFDTTMDPDPTYNVRIIYGNASDIPGNLKFAFAQFEILDWTPALLDPFRWSAKGYSEISLLDTQAAGDYWLDATTVQNDSDNIIAGPVGSLTGPGLRREVVLVGVGPGTAKLVSFERPYDW
jgi:hypothetical protein